MAPAACSAKTRLHANGLSQPHYRTRAGLVVGLF